MAAPRTSISANANTRTLKILEPGSRGKDDFCDNKVITSHYTLANFIPRNAYEQFSKPANVYFLFLSILQCTPRITTTSGVPTILLPLVCILTLNAIKDAIEDWRRHKSDKMENERTTTLVRDKTSKEVTDKWQQAHVGDLIVMKNNDYIPADLVILSTSHEEGQVFIETANLDGETNLKTKSAPDNVLKLIGKHEKLEDAAQTIRTLSGEIECDEPNEFLYSFMGTMLIGKPDKPAERVPLDESMVVLRGCKVKNVAWAIGVAVYTGKQTKIMMNSKQRTARKLSHLEYEMGKFTAAIFILQNILCLLAGIGSAVFETSENNLARRYLNLEDKSGNADGPFLVFIIRFFNFIILFSNFIPISLLVSVSMVKLIQVFFMYSDVDMIHGNIHCMPRTSDLNEEMGQIEYVFSDKTGTLTCNVMDFRKFCVDGVVYGEGMTEIRRNVLLKMGQVVEEPATPLQVGGKITPHVDLLDHRLDELLRSKSGAQYTAVRTFLLHLAINHEVVAEAGEGGLPNYSASSPDEAALAYGARHFGFVFFGRDSQGVNLQLEDGSSMRVQVLAILKFNSTRKRSSAIVRYEDTAPGGVTTSRLQILTKGADSVIMARLAPRLLQAPSTLKCHQVVKEFAEDGLRTLCLAGRDLTQEELDRWLVHFQEASVSTRNRQEKLDQVADEIETNLEIHGITGIEDRLQDDVANTIVKMTQAGIKVWMLTGDKVETAINIGIATGLLEPVEGEAGDRPVFVSSDFEVDGVFQPQDMCRKLRMVAERARASSKAGTLYEGFVVDGKCLEVCLEPSNELEFVAISRTCKTVVCCRVSPKQKGAVVRLIKRIEKAITLAIGDGANDCNMIQSADVGVGIRGLEGLQAFNVSDYGISQFRFLQNLLFVHGRWCYRRVAILVNYTFYKNIVVVLPQYFLGCVSGFSGQKLYNDLLYQSYNVVHSMLPILLFGILDQDVSKQVALRFPELYGAGLRHEYLNFKVSAGWLASGVWHSFVIFFLPYYVMSNGNTTHSDGKANDIWLLGTVVYLLLTIVVNLRALLETFFITGLTFFGILFSFLWWFIQHGWLSGFLTGNVFTAELHGTTQRIFGCPMIYLVMIAAIALALMADIQCKGLMCVFRPSTLQKVQEAVLAEAREARTRAACTPGTKLAS